MTILEIVEKYLKDGGFDGLYNPDQCACKTSDLSPGDCLEANCEPGYLQPGDEEYDWYIGPTKAEVPNDN
jgi:hypothetical protein